MHTQAGELGQIWRNIGRLEASTSEIRRRVERLEKSQTASPITGHNINRIEKWAVRLLTLAAPIGTLWVTGSWEAALKVLSQSLR